MLDPLKIVRALRHLGPRITFQSIVFAIRRDRMERHLRDLHAGDWQAPGRALPDPLSTRPFRISFGQMQLTVEFLADDILRLTWHPGADPPGYALAQTPVGSGSFDVQREGNGWLLSGQELQVRVSDAGELAVLAHDGRTLRSDSAPLRRGPGWSLRTELQAGECIYGLGERSQGPNLRPGRYRLWNTDPPWSYGPGDDPLYMSIPVMLHVRDGSSYLVFFENSHDGWVELDEECEVEFTAGALRYYFIPGPPDRALSRYIELTGRPSMPPRWALGFHQSRWGYEKAEQIREVASRFHERGLPITAIHLDIDYMDGFRMFSIDEVDFPDLASLSGELSEMGIRLVTILDPGVKWDPDYPVFRDGRSAGAYCTSLDGQITRGVVWPGWVAYPDFTSFQGRRWWGDQYTKLLENGVSGFWHDMNEPVSFAAWGDKTLPLPTRHAFDGEPGDHRQGHNLYALQMNRAGFEALRRLVPGKRPWILSRSGWAGNQRYAWNWTGDTQSTWEALRMTVATVIGLSLSGIHFTGPDAGGFSGSPEAELFTRWFQLAALLPFFRVHSSIDSLPREPWTFDDETQTVLRGFLQLRAELMPYLYTLAARSAQHGEPLIRPLFWPDGSDPQLFGVDDAYFLGESLLIAPILDQGARSRFVRLPAGTWYSFWTGQIVGGQADVEIEAPLSRIPILVRAGTVLPLWNGRQHVLRVYAPVADNRSFSSLYLDDGDGYESARWDLFSLEQTGAALYLSHSMDGKYVPPEAEFGIELAVPHPQADSALSGSAARRGSVEPGFRAFVIPTEQGGK